MMAKIQLDVPSKLHVGVKEIQLKREGKGKKETLKEIYYEVIEKGIECMKKENPDH